MAHGEEGEISLSAYDTDTPKGNKIAIFKYDNEGEYIAVDYCSGSNNNNFDTELRKQGFRFYWIRSGELMNIFHDNNPDLAPEGIFITPDNELGDYELFAEGDMIEDLLTYDDLKTLKIYDIKTGENASFKYSFSDAEYSSDENESPNDEQTEPSGESRSGNEGNDSSDDGQTKPSGEIQSDNEEKTEIPNKTESKQSNAVTGNSMNGSSVSNTKQVVTNTERKVLQSVERPINSSSPRTGDYIKIPIWIAIAGASVVVLTTSLVLRRKKKNN